MRVLKGHLTETNKRHIKALLAANLTEGKVNRTNYKLELIEPNTYKVTIGRRERHTIGADVTMCFHRATFTL